MSSVDLSGLFRPFSLDDVRWRAQSVRQNYKTKQWEALALAYIDARDVMDRLNEVCGVAGWQCKYSHANGKTICDIGIKCGDEWIWKADGAGDTDVEAEKGAISDAFKRAAVKWGVGMYLYKLGQTYVPCEVYESNGKQRFSKFLGDPWQYVKGDVKRRDETSTAFKERYSVVKGCILAAESYSDLASVLSLHAPSIDEFNREQQFRDDIANAKSASIARLFNEIKETISSSNLAELQTLWAGWTKDLNALKALDIDVFQQLNKAKDYRKDQLTTNK